MEDFNNDKIWRNTIILTTLLMMLQTYNQVQQRKLRKDQRKRGEENELNKLRDEQK